MNTVKHELCILCYQRMLLCTTESCIENNYSWFFPFAFLSSLLYLNLIARFCHLLSSNDRSQFELNQWVASTSLDKSYCSLHFSLYNAVRRWFLPKMFIDANYLGFVESDGTWFVHGDCDIGMNHGYLQYAVFSTQGAFEMVRQKAVKLK